MANMSEMQKMGFKRPPALRCGVCGWDKEAHFVVAASIPELKDLHACERCGSAMVEVK